MDTPRPRRLAAVWFADIVGYSSLSSRDEDAALALVEALKAAALEEVPAHGGRVVKFVGDAALAVFESVDGALRAALSVQERFGATAAARTEEARLRVGLHLGEIAEADDGDVFGDGVNVAARLQGKARPGEVLVSRAVKEMIRGRAGYVFQRVPMWHHLKGLGLARVFVVTDADAPPPPRRKLPARAIGVGLAAGIAGFLLLLSNVAMHDDGGVPAGEPVPVVEPPPSAGALEDGDRLLNLGVDHYFAGELADAEAALEPFARPPLSRHPEAPRALRYLARAQREAGSAEEARSTLEAMVGTEPPLALLIPSAEDPALMALYYEARRAALRDRAGATPTVPVGAVVLFDLETALDDPDPTLGDLGATVSTMLASELEAAGIATQTFWALLVGITGERAYGHFRSQVAAGERAATHALLGRVALREGEVALSAQVYELATGALVSTQVVTGAWPDGFFEVVERLGSAVAVDLARAPEPGGRE